MSDYTKEIFKNEKKGFTKYPWYLTYYSMMVRCYREGSYNYKNYGARGISVCEEWHDISKFKEKWYVANVVRVVLMWLLKIGTITR